MQKFVFSSKTLIEGGLVERGQQLTLSIRLYSLGSKSCWNKNSSRDRFSFLDISLSILHA